MAEEIRNKIALAVDNQSDIEKIESLIAATAPWTGVFKIGLEQYIRFGPPILNLVRNARRKIFLDLKLHDIPNTVAQAVRSACDLGVDYLTVHTQGGSEMLKAAIKSRNEHSGDGRPAIIGVTLLTSIGADMLRNGLKVEITLQEYVRHLALQAVEAGIDGIVCSAADLSVVAPVLPDHYTVITPGIRPAGRDAHDQKRIATPATAIQAGATILVLGRAVTAADDPGIAAQTIYNEIAGL
ncbi:MAG: orotidine-5'-phosphate decarboxylase [Chitinispirillaceae bacterium]|nr:orotidine-5'-phosphate decarboxylase [Chitinispirillaceae bacterium]